MSRSVWILGVACVALVAGSLSADPTTRIAFVRLAGGIPYSIWTMDPDGTNQVQLTSDGDLDPAWSPDGTKIAFDSARAGNYELYYMNANGSGVVRLTSNGSVDHRPRWSPDGTQVVFESDRDGGIDNVFIANVCGDSNADGLDDCANDPPYRVTPVKGSSPVWHPTENLIAYDRSGEIYTIRTNGSLDTQLTTDAGHLDIRPRWSYNGNYIGWSKIIEPVVVSEIDIWLMRKNGTGQHALTTEPLAETDPNWSPPTGARIAYSKGGCVNGNCLGSDIWIMAADGTGAFNITNTPATFNDPKSENSPDWSPLLP